MFSLSTVKNQLRGGLCFETESVDRKWKYNTCSSCFVLCHFVTNKTSRREEQIRA